MFSKNSLSLSLTISIGKTNLGCFVEEKKPLQKKSSNNKKIIIPVVHMQDFLS
jgi:hypothetical protein